MNKKTKIIIGIAVVGIGAYLYYKHTHPTTATTAATTPAKTNYTGNTVGDVQK